MYIAFRIQINQMYTLHQIKIAHSKVKSGADFPSYIREIKMLGVRSYETFVKDGHTNYYCVNGSQASTSANYDDRMIAEEADSEQFKMELKNISRVRPITQHSLKCAHVLVLTNGNCQWKK
jgi:hypothetical protein